MSDPTVATVSVDMAGMLAILLSLFGFIPDNENSTLHPEPTGGDSQSAVYELSARGALALVMANPIPLPEITNAQAEAFWKQVKKMPENGCWEWTGAVSGWGYGYFGINYKEYRAHRVAWKIATGKDPERLVLHRCDNKKCVRFDHLFEGTNQDNSDDAVKKCRTSRGDSHSKALLKNRPRGDGHSNAVLTESQVIEMRNLHASGVSRKELQRQFGVSKGCVCMIITRRNWRHI